MPLIWLGPWVFSSGGVNPQVVAGPTREHYVVEHPVPGREGGIVEYVGSRQSTYQLRGFLAEPGADWLTQTVGSILSGTAYTTRVADAGKNDLIGLRGSGALLLKIESTWDYAVAGGVTLLGIYENDFFYITDMTFGFEPGKLYPYYPYTIGLRRGSPRTYGQSSGLSAAPATLGDGGYLSGYIRSWQIPLSAGEPAGASLGETINSIGIYFPTVGSGSAKAAIYNNVSVLQAQSASQTVISGWNYFALRPSFASISGHRYQLAFKGNASNTSGYTVGFRVGTAGDESYRSGTVYSDDFPAPYAPGTGAGTGPNNYAEIMVTA